MDRSDKQLCYDALAATYPILHRLVGTPFFALLVTEYCAQSDEDYPNSDSIDFGCRFGQLLLRQYAAHPELDKLAVLAELARMEWLRHDAAHVSTLPPDCVGAEQVSENTICASPGLRMMYSFCPLINIWRAYCANRMETISQAGGHQWLCIFHDHNATRPETQIEALGDSEAKILGAVLKGYTLSEIRALTPGSTQCLTKLLKRHWLTLSGTCLQHTGAR